MQLRQPLRLSLVTSQSLHFVVMTRICRSRHFMVVGSCDVGVWRSSFVHMLPLYCDHAEKLSFDGRYRFRTPRGQIATLIGRWYFRGCCPLNDKNPIRKSGFNCLDAFINQRLNLASTHLPLQRIKDKSRYGISVSTPHRRCGHRLRTPFLRTPFEMISETPSLEALQSIYLQRTPNIC